MKNKVAIYVRVSTVYQVEKDSLPTQKNDLVNYCKLILNTDDYEIFEDAGYSGKNTDRPAFQRMMSKVRAREFTHVLVWKIDRISRNLLDFASMYSELKKLDVVFVSKNEQFDTSSAMGEAMLKIILVFAELERNITSERVTAIMISRAGDGLWNGGNVPYGYDYDKETKTFSLNESEAENVRTIHAKYLELRSLIHVASYMNQIGTTTRRGNPWQPTAINKILGNYFYCGDYLYNVHNEKVDKNAVKPESEWILYKDHHPAIIDRATKDKICDLQTFNDRGKKSDGTHSYRHSYTPHVFGGLIYCGKCGSRMYSSSHKKAHGIQASNYGCAFNRGMSCDQSYTSDTVIGEFIFNLILNMINSQKAFLKTWTMDDLQCHLLKNSVFKKVKCIHQDSLASIYDLLSSGTQSDIYGKDVSIKPRPAQTSTRKLANAKAKYERALDRLSDLYLYSNEAISDLEYIKKRNEILDSIKEIDEKLNSLAEESKESPDDFIKLASEFMISQELSNREYISYIRIEKTISQSVLEEFTHTILNKIIYDGVVKEVYFKNGIDIIFEY